MVVWMLFRGVAWRKSYEMTAAMVLPVIPFLCLVWLNITNARGVLRLDGGGHARAHALSPQQVLDADVAGGPVMEEVPAGVQAGR
jgi:hypothetical protein